MQINDFLMMFSIHNSFLFNLLRSLNNEFQKPVFQKASTIFLRVFKSQSDFAENTRKNLQMSKNEVLASVAPAHFRALARTSLKIPVFEILLDSSVKISSGSYPARFRSFENRQRGNDERKTGLG